MVHHVLLVLRSSETAAPFSGPVGKPIQRHFLATACGFETNCHVWWGRPFFNEQLLPCAIAIALTEHVFMSQHLVAAASVGD